MALAYQELYDVKYESQKVSNTQQRFHYLHANAVETELCKNSAH